MERTPLPDPAAIDLREMDLNNLSFAINFFTFGPRGGFHRLTANPGTVRQERKVPRRETPPDKPIRFNEM
jgi:hypothetical protein